MPNISIGGLVSGINTDSIIEGMMKIQQNQLDLINSKKTTIQTKQTAYSTLQTQLLTLRTSATTLAGTSNNPFDARIAKVSDESALIATAGARANPGSYQLTIQKLASAHSIGSSSVANAESAITHGTLSIRVGSEAFTNITVDSNNDTLNGLANSINNANIGVTASLIQDQTAAYRLVLTSTKTGIDKSIQINNELGESTSTATQPLFDMAHPIQTANDAIVSLGSGTGAIVVTSSTNSISNLVTGVTLNLQKADTEKPITLTIAHSTDKSVAAVKDFVDAYNGFLDYLDDVTRYDLETDVGGILQGDYSVISIRNQLQSAIQSVIPNANVNANRLSALGISTSNAGRLILNENHLQEVLDGNRGSVSTADLRKLFAIEGSSSHQNLSFLYAGPKTSSTLTDLQVKITRAAERAQVQGTSTIASNVTIGASNNRLRINIDGVDAEITIESGEYSTQQLAAQIQKGINNHSAMTGRSVTVGVNATSHLTISSESYGTASKVAILGGSAAASLGFNGLESDMGVNVAGELIVNGEVEAATGIGRTLTGSPGNKNTDGLQIRVGLSPEQVGFETTEKLTLSRGVASRLNSSIDKIMHAETGLIVSLEQRLNKQLANSQAQIDRQTEIFEKQKQSLLSRFQAMESITLTHV